MTDSYDFDLLCIGSGPAGQRGAVQAAKLGKRAAIIERGMILGGVCVDKGTIPSKTFREAVLYFSTRSDVRPTAELLMARVSEVMRSEAEVVRDQLRRNGVDVIRGSAQFVDPHRLMVTAGPEHRTVTADKILIACGTRPAVPPGVLPDGQLIITSDDVIGLKKLPRSMVVVGAGVIGIEYASMFAALGIAVTVVEKRERPLDFLDGEIVDELMHQMRARNVTFRMGENVERLEIAEGPPRRAVVLLESGKRITSDLVLFSAGRVAVTDLLNLPACGVLQADERGRLHVDATFRTNVEHIYAAGDVIGYPSLASTSAEQGRLAACNMFGVAACPMAPHFPIGIYAIPELSMVGVPEHELTEKKIPYETGIAHYREIARGHILGDEDGLLKMLFHREDRRLLGVHVIGTGATELVHVGQAVLGLGGGLDYFVRTVFNYPTLAECYKVAALNAANKLAG